MESEKDAVARLTGDLQWGVKGAPFAEYGPDNDATGALFPKRRRSSVALFGPFSAVFKRFRHRLTNPPRSAPRDIERREIRPVDSPQPNPGTQGVLSPANLQRLCACSVAIPADFQRQRAR